jgi:hypothetical protein
MTHFSTAAQHDGRDAPLGMEGGIRSVLFIAPPLKALSGHPTAALYISTLAPRVTQLPSL